jgi:hypothetical protein
MTKDMRFNGDKYNTIVITYKTETDYTAGEIFFTTKESANLADNHIYYDMDAAAEFTELEIDMRDDDQGNWKGEVGSIRIDPATSVEDQVFYFKSLKVKEGAEIPAETEKATEAKTEAPTVANTDAPKPADTKAPDTNPVLKPEKSNAGLIIGIICGTVGVAAIVAVVMIVIKKKKK